MLMNLHGILSANKFCSRMSITTTITEITYAENNIIWKRQGGCLLSSSIWTKSTGPIMVPCSCHSLLNIEDDF